MIESSTRRQMLAVVPIALVPFSGCVPEGGSQADLGMEVLNVTATNDEHSIEIEIEGSTRGEQRPFQNVSVVAKNKGGEVVCRHSIGEIDAPSTLDPITFMCSEFPYTIAYELDLDPCDPNVSIYKRVYDEEIDGWREQVECG